MTTTYSSNAILSLLQLPHSAQFLPKMIFLNVLKMSQLLSNFCILPMPTVVKDHSLLPSCKRDSIPTR